MSTAVEGLVRLGFSEYEAKAYVAMVSIGEGGISEISQQSGIPRSRVYDVMERLALKGFAEVGATKPLRYRAVDPNKVTNQLRTELTHTADLVQVELKDLRGTTDKMSMPLWLVQGEGTIDLEIKEFIGKAQPGLILLAMSNSLLLRHAKAIAERSKKIQADIVVVNEPEGFKGLLGRTNILRLPEATAASLEWILGAELPTNQRDRTVKSELVLISGNNSMLVYKEEDVRRAIRIEGTIIGRFIFAFAGRVIQESEPI